MKSTSIIFTLAALLSAAHLSFGHAHEHSTSKAYNKAVIEHRLFKALELSDAQKQDIAQIVRETRDDNAIYKGDRRNIKQQMHTLMQQAEWDKAAAEDIVSQQAAQFSAIALNSAEARYRTFNVLSAEQQAEFMNLKAEKTNKREEQKQNPSKTEITERLQKRLRLSDKQIEAFEQLKDEHQEKVASLRAKLGEAKKREDDLVYTSEFDQQAWTELSHELEQTRSQLKVELAHFKHQMLQILDEQQKHKFAKMMKKRRLANHSGRDWRRFGD